MTTALVTGANKGIGYETARLLGERGFTVLVCARDEAAGGAAAQRLRDGGAAAVFVQLDVTDPESVARATKRVEDEYGSLDVLVNNAGIAKGEWIASASTVASMREVYETNVVGIVALTNALLPLLRRAPAARIVNVSSEVGSVATQLRREGPLWRMTGLAYPASKAALNMVTVMYAKELWDTPIKVNAANPGYCATDLNGNSGYRTPEQGALVSVHLATLGEDGPTGVLWGDLSMSHGDTEDGVLPW
ncbi:dehydrogenase [Catellatospora sp. TT07R-123]|uniref:SDR family oxidoreductase n=1 Tax=Catellatospora sp. TT07R-123 TaxID=2733863 RepID=UPI001B20CE67|nr:SDR family oxidoreductase [Catellatospora sp. TT07R-123]GHJ49016.1 dehydrogenase [Catellatospora sp. TT07R-123]